MISLRDVLRLVEGGKCEANLLLIHLAFHVSV